MAREILQQVVVEHWKLQTSVDDLDETDSDDGEHKDPDRKLDALELRHCKLLGCLGLEAVEIRQPLPERRQRRSPEGVENAQMPPHRRSLPARIGQTIGKKPQIGLERHQK